MRLPVCPQLTRGASGSWRCRVEAVQKLPRNMIQGPANGCVGQHRKPPIAVPCKLGIERDGPEAGDLQV